MKKIDKKISKIIYWLLFLFVVLVAIVPTLSTLNVPLPFRLYSVQTGSMQPSIKIGDLIFVKGQKEYLVNDVITFKDSRVSKTTITHRIVEVNEDGTFRTKGDSNKALDLDNVNKKDIVGKYIFRIPLLGYPINFVKTPLGFFLLIVIPAVILSYEELKRIKREKLRAF